MEFLGDSHLLLLKSELIDSQAHTHTYLAGGVGLPKRRGC